MVDDDDVAVTLEKLEMEICSEEAYLVREEVELLLVVVILVCVLRLREILRTVLKEIVCRSDTCIVVAPLVIDWLDGVPRTVIITLDATFLPSIHRIVCSALSHRTLNSVETRLKVAVDVCADSLHIGEVCELILLCSVFRLIQCEEITTCSQYCNHCKC